MDSTIHADLLRRIDLMNIFGESKTCIVSQPMIRLLTYLLKNGILENEFIVIGAHYDHLGWGGESSGSLDPDAHAIHNGADDNASGITALIELTDFFLKNKQNNKRGIIFVSFGAEEMGLLGSSYFIENSPIETENIVAMVNLDMIGRMKEKKLINRKI